MKDPGFDVHEPVAEFRGARDYVHSTDLYDEIVRGAEALGLNFAGPVDLRIKARITRQPRSQKAARLCSLTKAKHSKSTGPTRIAFSNGAMVARRT